MSDDYSINLIVGKQELKYKCNVAVMGISSVYMRSLSKNILIDVISGTATSPIHIAESLDMKVYGPAFDFLWKYLNNESRYDYDNMLILYNLINYFNISRYSALYKFVIESITKKHKGDIQTYKKI